MSDRSLPRIAPLEDGQATTGRATTRLSLAGPAEAAL